MSSCYLDTQYNNFINLDSISPLLSFNMDKKITEELDNTIHKCLLKESGGRLKKATVFSSSLNKDVYQIDKRISNRLSLKNKEITEFLMKAELINYLNSRTQNFSWSLYNNHYDYIEYENNGFFNKHRDFQWVYYPNTIQMTCLIGLEDCKSGGETKIWLPKYFDTKNNKKDIIFDSTCKKGGILIFPSHWFHSGNLVKDKKRLFMMTLLCEYHLFPKRIVKCDKINYYQTYVDIVKNNLFQNIPFKQKEIDEDICLLEKNSDYIEIETSDDNIMKVSENLIKNSNISCLLNIYDSKKLKLPYTFKEMNIILRYLLEGNISMETLRKKDKDKSYLDILMSLGFLDPLLIEIGNKTNSKTMRILDKLINKKIKIGIWSNFQPWMIDIVSKIKNIIPFVIINKFHNGTHKYCGMDIYNVSFLKYNHISFINRYNRLYIMDEKQEYDDGNLLNNIHNILSVMLDGSNLLDNSHRMIQKYKNTYQYKLPNKYAHIIEKNIDCKKGIPKYLNIYPCQDYENILKEIEKILNNGGEYIPSKFNIENWKKKYHKYTYYGNDSHSDYYDYDEDCNGYDEWGGFYKEEENSKYNREIVTVRYGLYFRD
jgi:hypothetical protein